MTEWYIATLGELGKFQSGFAFKSRDWVQSGVPVVKIQNVRDGRVSLGSCAYVEPDVAQAAARHRLSRGDVLVTMSGEIGAVGVVSSDEHILLNQRVGRLILHEFDPDMLRYLGYALQHPDLKVRMEAMAYGAAQPNISPSLLSTLPIAIPDIAGQRAIGIALEAVDNLIDNFRRRAAVLEEMQQALYREWFTKFRFPGHETEPIVTSTLGQRPESWRVGQLSDVGGVTIGGDWGEDEPQSNDWIQVACLRGVDLPRLRMGSTSGVRTRWVKDKSLEKRQLSDRDVVVEGSGECGRALAITDRLLKLIERPAVYSNFCKRLRCRTPAHARFVARLLNTMVADGSMAAFKTGTAIPNLNFQALVSEHAVLLPTDDILDCFETATRSMEAFAHTGVAEKLVGVRNLLLPKLVSGQFDIRQPNLDDDSQRTLV